LKQKLPKNKLIFVCGNGDIAFAKYEWLLQIIDEIENRSENTFLLQTKKPFCLSKFHIPDNCIVGTTIETNKDIKNISHAPPTEIRIRELQNINHSRKTITHEPIYDFDMDVIVDWDKSIEPEIVWIGYENHTKKPALDEPELKKTNKLIKALEAFTDVRLKTIREKL
jgi:hypothetical protein